MSKKVEQNYKKYLYNNFKELLQCLQEKIQVDDFYVWEKELKAYNNIFASLMGILEAKDKNKHTHEALQDCKDFILRYYEETYPEKQLEAIDEALFSEDCYEYIVYASKNMIKDNRDKEILTQFGKAYLKGYNIADEVKLQSILPYYFNKIDKYKYQKRILSEVKEKTI